jgi:hypothetical protein
MISGQIIAVAIMFLATVFTAALFFVPVTCFARKKPLTNFYWCGFWAFLALITGFAGASSTMMLLGAEDPAISNFMLSSLTSAYVAFVVIAWFHLTGRAAFSFIKARIK